MTADMRRPRVLMILSNFHPVVGGTENQALLLCRALLRRGVGVAVLTRRVPGLPDDEHVDGVPVLRSIRVIDRGKLFGVTYFLTCLVYLVSHRREYDIIHCHILHGFHSLAALCMKLLFGKKVIIKVASSGALSDFTMLKNCLCGPWMLGLLKHADRIIALSRSSVAEAHAHGFPDGQIAVMPNGVDAARFRPASGHTGARGRIVYAGSLGANKGLDVLLDAFSLLQREHAGLMLDIFGSGPLEDSLRHAAAGACLAGSVRFHGSVPDMERRFDSTCIFVQPSLVEGMSNVILEAMAAGLPVVATRTGAAEDIIQDGATGLLVDPGSAGQINDAVQRLLSDADLADRIGRAARTLAESRYGIEQVAASYHALYRELIVPERAGGAIRPSRETQRMHDGHAWKPRVLMALSYFHPFCGGAENQALLLAEALQERGVDVSVLTRSFKGLPVLERIRGVPVHRRIRTVEAPLLFSLWYAVSCIAFMALNRKRYDIIHCHILQGFHSPAAVIAGLLFKKMTVIKITSSGPTSDFSSLSKVFLGAFILKVLRRADRLAVTSAASAREALEQGFSREQVVCIPNGVDTRRFAPRNGPAQARTRIICVGRLISGKGHTVLLDAFAQLYRESGSLRLEIVGDGPEKRNLERKAEQLGLGRAVVFHGETASVETFFDNTAVAVQPSLSEGMSNVILEAMAAGLPVIATRTGAAPDVIRNGVNGILVDPGSADQISDAVKQIISDEALARRLGAGARRTVEERYAISSIAEKYMDLYRGLAALYAMNTGREP